MEIIYVIEQIAACYIHVKKRKYPMLGRYKPISTSRGMESQKVMSAPMAWDRVGVRRVNPRLDSPEKNSWATLLHAQTLLLRALPLVCPLPWQGLARAATIHVNSDCPCKRLWCFHPLPSQQLFTWDMRREICIEFWYGKWKLWLSIYLFIF